MYESRRGKKEEEDEKEEEEGGKKKIMAMEDLLQPIGRIQSLSHHL